MENWKTTLTGLVTGIAVVLSHFGIIVPHDVEDIVIAVGAIVLGLVAKDAKGSNG